MTHDIRAAIGCSWGDDLVDDPDPYVENGAAPIYEGEFFTEPHTFIGFRPIRRMRARA